MLDLKNNFEIIYQEAIDNSKNQIIKSQNSKEIINNRIRNPEYWKKIRERKLNLIT